MNLSELLRSVRNIFSQAEITAISLRATGVEQHERVLGETLEKHQEQEVEFSLEGSKERLEVQVIRGASADSDNNGGYGTTITFRAPKGTSQKVRVSLEGKHSRMVVVDTPEGQIVEEGNGIGIRVKDPGLEVGVKAAKRRVEIVRDPSQGKTNVQLTLPEDALSGETKIIFWDNS